MGCKKRIETIQAKIKVYTKEIKAYGSYENWSKVWDKRAALIRELAELHRQLPAGKKT